MKVINLNESQYKRLFEMDSFVKSGGNDDEGQNTIPDFQNQEEVVTTSKIDDEDGGVKNSIPPTSQKKQDTMSADGPWQRPGRVGGY